MKIRIKNLGPLEYAEFEPGDLTIICGENNTGKTYATYAYYGFLEYWRDGFIPTVPKKYAQELSENGYTEIDLNEFIDKSQEILDEACMLYKEKLPKVFASKEELFSTSIFEIDISSEKIIPEKSYESNLTVGKSNYITLTKGDEDSSLQISWLVENGERKIQEVRLSKLIGKAIKSILFNKIFNNVFISTAERTGINVFIKEFKLTRLDKQKDPTDTVGIIRRISNVFSSYALPIFNNIRITSNLDHIFKSTSIIKNKYPDLIDDFSEIIGGSYSVSQNDEILYNPRKGKRLELTTNESSSAVRSLVDLGFYLRHIAMPGDLFMIDEPELNLHPENQRRIARLFARMVNVGIKLFMTTHSDYIVKELNTLIMLNHDKPHLKRIREDEGYKESELLDAKKVKVYIADKASVLVPGETRKRKIQTLVPADIDPELGIEAKTFDKTIMEMNRIQDEIVWSEE